MDAAFSGGHRAKRLRVDGRGQVQIGDRHYHASKCIWSLSIMHNDNEQHVTAPNSGVPVPRFNNKYYEIPRNPSPFFTGREEICERLRASCLPSNISSTLRQQRRFVIYGLGGSGKTQLCLKFAENHREE